MANDQNAVETLSAAPIPELISNLGAAVASANKSLLEADEEVAGTKTVFAISHAEIEVKVAISMRRGSKTEVGGGFSAGYGLLAFNVNASYARTYSYDETASSTIKLTMAAVPRRSPPATTK